MTTEHFILKDDGKLYHVTMPEFPAALNQFDPHDVSHYENVILNEAIYNAVEVSNQEQLKAAIFRAHEGMKEINEASLYSLQCSVQILPWSTLRILAVGDTHKQMPLKGNGALVTFPSNSR